MYSQRARGIALLLAAEIRTPLHFELFHATIFEVSLFFPLKKSHFPKKNIKKKYKFAHHCTLNCSTPRFLRVFSVCSKKRHFKKTF